METSTQAVGPHPTPEVQLPIEGADLPELFEEAGYALAEVLLGQAPWDVPLDGEEEHLTLEAADTKTLLVDWLNALLARWEQGGKVYAYFLVDELTESRLHARIRGFRPPSLEWPVKSATCHGLEIHEHEDGFTATLALTL
ncbi:archease [Hyalangium versicolor]|uniref:archease n=1 Tax=Hyalangium versicolor TaxID=2861190 RepID=UPI001CCB142D|nr:archease [Hyalangium versicolor]